MMQRFTLEQDRCGLLVIDMQDKILNGTERLLETVKTVRMVVEAAQELELPLIATEQYPEGLGATTASLIEVLPAPQLPKNTFSCCGDSAINGAIDAAGRSQWILTGIEAHVCVLQTARDLIEKGKQVVVLNDAITSRSIFDYSTAIAEMRDMGVRISSAEIVLFEMLKGSSHLCFKAISQLVKARYGTLCCQRG